ncbi:MAG TPA: DUF4126 domain-containing protein [Candidatus Methylomirabilis sp.]
MDAFLSLGVGLGLSAACGFRVFVPLLVASIAAQAGYLSLSPGFEWIGTPQALYAFATATLLEVLAYCIPWLDNALDAIATPAAVIAGILASASVLTDLPPLLKWGAALIGGGVAGITQGASVLLRLKSALFTGGLGSPLVSTAELIAALVVALLAILLPLACLVLIAGLCIAAFRLTGRLVFGRHRNRGGTSSPS